MTVEAYKEEKKLILKIAGRVDNTTAPLLEKELRERLDSDTAEILLDFFLLDYISSAGLRVLLTMQKLMNKRNGKMIIKNANAIVTETFKITGFLNILTVEQSGRPQ